MHVRQFVATFLVTYCSLSAYHSSAEEAAPQSAEPKRLSMAEEVDTISRAIGHFSSAPDVIHDASFRVVSYETTTQNAAENPAGSTVSPVPIVEIRLSTGQLTHIAVPKQAAPFELPYASRNWWTLRLQDAIADLPFSLFRSFDPESEKWNHWLPHVLVEPAAQLTALAIQPVLFTTSRARSSSSRFSTSNPLTIAERQTLLAKAIDRFQEDGLVGASYRLASFQQGDLTGQYVTLRKRRAVYSISFADSGESEVRCQRVPGLAYDYRLEQDWHLRTILTYLPSNCAAIIDFASSEFASSEFSDE